MVGVMKPRRPDPDSILPRPLRETLDTLRDGLLALHKILLDHERARYERYRGPISSAGEFLQRVIHDPQFNWLHALSESVVQIDEMLWSREPVDSAHAAAIADQVRSLVQPNESGSDFQKRYHEAIQESPDVAAAHAQWRKATSLS